MPWVVCVLQAIVERPSRYGFNQVQQGPSETIALVWPKEMHEAPRFGIADGWRNPAQQALIHLELLFFSSLTVWERPQV
jgi:hypothetical protein